jgi:type I restriction enzyme M protein
MLTAETKRKIDYLRDVLVGKIPVPSQQIEQITLGLIYKFMSDIDEQNEELGGKSFFSDEYKKYSWKNIMDRSLAGHERVLFYSEGLEKMGHNDKIPQLFRDIFKGAFLPFKDPTILDLFLKGINEFKYANSEELGNAFEYLLSTAASQGDAGQFRTPRHIIDFIVEVVDPQKEDKILDPACGTAGFLVSAYKHILKNNTDKKSGKPGSLLTATERKKLTKNIVGYDISHEMVRLSLVNLYLHGFAEPSIYEYDTLSSLDRWDDNFDCLLANPPFMTPRGGIKPHNRFPIQAKRSEVLFVDYITEHLTPNGKAGIIVPEGIIFQSGNAYKQLRKMLVEDGLWAVVSLPQGVFNPYAGVKTSILFFNNTIARQTKEILFAKVENDGFDLGAQRRPIDKDDLPTRLEVLKKYKKVVQEGKKFSLSKDEEKFASVVKKEKIAENGEYNLSASRYIEVVANKNQKWPLIELKEVCVVDWGNTNLTKSSYVKNGEYLGVSAAGCDGRMENYEHEIGVSVLSAIGANCGRIFYPLEKFTAIKNTITFTPDQKRILPKYLFYALENNKLPHRGGAQPFISKGDTQKYKIPLPPIEVQKEIVAELDGYQKIIDGAQQIADNYKPTIKIDPKWKTVELEVLADTFIDGNWIESKDQSKSGIRLLQTGNVGFGEYLNKGDRARYISEETFKRLKCIEVKTGDVLISRLPDPVGRACIIPELKIKLITAVDCTIVRFDPAKMLPIFFVAYTMTSDYYRQLSQFLTGASRQRISRGNLGKIKIPVPPIEEQRKIIQRIQEEQKIVEANKELIKLFEQKIKDKISEVWGE